MKVILLQDIARVGRKHEVTDVSEGHAQNYLIPRGLVMPATEHNLKRHSEQKARIEMQAMEAAASFAQFFARVGTAPVVVTAPANEHGHLFRGLHAADIAEALSAAAGGVIPADALTLERPIKEVGKYPIVVKVGDMVKTVTIAVNAQ